MWRNVAVVSAFGLCVLALASSVHPVSWDAFCRIFQQVCLGLAVVIVFVQAFGEALLKTEQLSRVRLWEMGLAAGGALLVLLGYGLWPTGDNSAVGWNEGILPVAALSACCVGILMMVVSFGMALKGTIRILRLYHYAKTGTDETELKALCDEIERVNRES